MHPSLSMIHDLLCARLRLAILIPIDNEDAPPKRTCVWGHARNTTKQHSFWPTLVTFPRSLKKTFLSKACVVFCTVVCPHTFPCSSRQDIVFFKISSTFPASVKWNNLRLDSSGRCSQVHTHSLIVFSHEHSLSHLFLSTPFLAFVDKIQNKNKLTEKEKRNRWRSQTHNEGCTSLHDSSLSAALHSSHHILHSSRVSVQCPPNTIQHSCTML